MKKKLFGLAGAILAFSLIFTGCGETPDDNESDNQNQEQQQNQNGGQNSSGGNGSSGSGTENGEGNGSEGSGTSGSGTENGGGSTSGTEGENGSGGTTGTEPGDEEDTKTYPYWDYYIAEENTWYSIDIKNSTEQVVKAELEAKKINNLETAQKLDFFNSYVSYNFKPETEGKYYFSFHDKSRIDALYTDGDYICWHEFRGLIRVVDSKSNVIAKYTPKEISGYFSYEIENENFPGWDEWIEIDVTEEMAGKKLSVQFQSEDQYIYGGDCTSWKETYNFSNVKISTTKPSFENYPNYAKIIHEEEVKSVADDLTINYKNSPVSIGEISNKDNSISFKASDAFYYDNGNRYSYLSKKMIAKANSEFKFVLTDENKREFWTGFRFDEEKYPNFTVDYIEDSDIICVKNEENVDVPYFVNIVPYVGGDYNVKIVSEDEFIDLSKYGIFGSFPESNYNDIPLEKNTDGSYSVTFTADSDSIYFVIRKCADNTWESAYRLSSLNSNSPATLYNNGEKYRLYKGQCFDLAEINGFEKGSKIKMTVIPAVDYLIVDLEEQQLSDEEKALYELKKNALEIGIAGKWNDGSTDHTWFYAKEDAKLNLEINGNSGDLIASYNYNAELTGDTYIWFGFNYDSYSYDLSTNDWSNYVDGQSVSHYKGQITPDKGYVNLTETTDSSELISLNNFEVGYEYNFYIKVIEGGVVQMKVEKGAKLLTTTLKLLVKGLPTEAEGQIAIIAGSYDGWASGFTSCWGGLNRYTELPWGKIKADGTVEIVLSKIVIKENVEYSYECCGYFGEPDENYDIPTCNNMYIELDSGNIPLKFTGKEGTYTFTVDMTAQTVTSSFSK